jgi:hypothetical protein
MQDLVQMERNDVIETIGSITKIENLRSLEYDILANSLVLKNIDPFPGYSTNNNKLSIAKKPVSIFIILKQQYDPSKINNILKKLPSDMVTKFCPSYGDIITHEAIYSCIRLKGIEHDSLVPAFQQHFVKKDLKLMDYKKTDGLARIKIFKSFRIIKIAEGLYRDLTETEKVYIRIPFSLGWKQFDNITKKSKHNLPNNNFDAATGIIYRFCGPEDVIRVYDQIKTIERALEIKKMYFKEIKNDSLISTHHSFLK